jgi:hypothetical protein
MRGYRTITVDIDARDVLRELSDDDLRDELRKRNAHTLDVFDDDAIEELRSLLMRGNVHEALVLIDRSIQPSTHAAELYRGAPKRGDAAKVQ